MTKAVILAMCQLHGYGAVMQTAADAWAEKDPVGALTVGPPVSAIRQAIKNKGSRSAFPSGAYNHGMDARTYLAAHAPMEVLDGYPGSADLSDKAALAVRWADALIEELQR